MAANGSKTLVLIAIQNWVFGRPFVKRLALCNAIKQLTCPVLSVTLLYCGQMVGCIKMKLGMQVRLDPRHIVLDGDQTPPPPKGQSPPQFSAHICCCQMAACIKMLLGREVGLGPGDIVLSRGSMLK